MTFTRLTFDVDGERQVSRAFSAMEHEVADMSEPLGAIGRLIREAIGEEFGEEGARGGAPWQPLSPQYEEWKEAHYPGRPLLVQTGAMRRALLSEAAFSVSPKRLVYEPPQRRSSDGRFADEIAGYHQRGSSPNPARRMVDVTPSDRRGFEREVHDWLNARRRRHFAA